MSVCTIVRLTAVEKDECRVMEMLHPKILDLLVSLGDIDTHAPGRAQVRRNNWIMILG
jgi:hypothetical protein